MIIQNKTLVDLNGDVIKSGEVELTVAQVLVNCALMPAEGGKGYPASMVASRYDAAIQLNRLKVGETIELPIELVSALKADVLRAYTVIIAGPMLKYLDGAIN